MLEISELIYETCKTYLLTQGSPADPVGIHRGGDRSLLRAFCRPWPDKPVALTLPIILLFSLVGTRAATGCVVGIRVEHLLRIRDGLRQS